MDATIYRRLAELLARDGASLAREIADRSIPAASARERRRAAAAGDAVSAFLHAESAVVQLEDAFGDVDPRLALELLWLDAAYQRARDDLRARTRAAPAIRALTGDVTEYDAVGAIQELLESLSRLRAAPWAARHLAGRIGAPPPAVAGAIGRIDGAHELREARAARARAFGPAVEHFATDLARRDRIGPAGAVMRLAPSDSAWTQAVVKVWCDDTGTEGSGVFIRQNLVVTAAHLIAPDGAPDPSRVHVEIPALGGARLTATDLPRVGSGGAEDYAIVAVPRASVPTMIVEGDFDPPDDVEITRFGFPTGGGPRGAKGHVSRYGDLFYTRDLHLPAGTSGCALAAVFAEGVRLVGLGTMDQPDAEDEFPMGIPLPEDLMSAGAGFVEARS